MSARIHADGDVRTVDAVVIGVSAGALETLRAIFAGIPKGFAAPILIVVHVPAHHESQLVHVLSRYCSLPMQEATDKERIADGVVYIAPPGYHLLVEPDRTLSLSIDPPVNFSRPSIDVLFESAAYAYRDRLLGIVLTGANEDGAHGLSVIRASGGLAWVQDPQTAMAAAMPRGALERAGADAIYDPTTMAAQLAALVET